MTKSSQKRVKIVYLFWNLYTPKCKGNIQCNYCTSSIETLGVAILNLTGQIDLPINLETSHYLFNNTMIRADNYDKIDIAQLLRPKWLRLQ